MLLIALLQLIAPILLTWLLFAINPILGIISAIWFTGVFIYGIKKK